VAASVDARRAALLATTSDLASAEAQPLARFLGNYAGNYESKRIERTLGLLVPLGLLAGCESRLAFGDERLHRFAHFGLDATHEVRILVQRDPDSRVPKLLLHYLGWTLLRSMAEASEWRRSCSHVTAGISANARTSAKAAVAVSGCRPRTRC